MEKHKPSFLRQSIYFLITILENITLTTYFVNYSSFFNMEDSYGDVHQLSNNQVMGIVIVIIILQILSLLLNLFYYDSHPARVSLTDLQHKMQIDILGTSWRRTNGRWGREKDVISTELEMGISLEELL